MWRCTGTVLVLMSINCVRGHLTEQADEFWVSAQVFLAMKYDDFSSVSQLR